jgi:hypothetical protein
MAQIESQHQRALFEWIRTKQTQDKRYAKIFAIPNGGKRDKMTAINLKREGVLSGVWDIFIPIPCNGLCGLWLEMKAGKNKLTQNQKNFREGLTSYYKFEVCYSWIEAKEVIETWLKK